jgi:hypothetical protein
MPESQYYVFYILEYPLRRCSMCGAFFAIPTAGLGFFFSAWLTMVFWGTIAPDFNIETIGYTKAMLITIAIWLVVAPLAAAVGKGKKGKFPGPF